MPDPSTVEKLAEVFLKFMKDPVFILGALSVYLLFKEWKFKAKDTERQATTAGELAYIRGRLDSRHKEDPHG